MSEEGDAANPGLTGLKVSADPVVPDVAFSAEPTPDHTNATPLVPNSGQLYRPICSCGWEGGLWQTYDDALLQVGDHIRHPDGLGDDLVDFEPSI